MSDVFTRPVLDRDGNLDRTDGKIVIERWQDVEDIIENNKRLQNTPQNTKTGWHHIGSVPNIFIEKYCNEKHVSYLELMRDFDHVIISILRDPDYRFLRTTDKKF